jgi:hypothetical protein
VEIAGEKRDWRQELGAKLLALQQEDGSWINPQSRWWESLPELVTSYSLVALAEMIGD